MNRTCGRIATYKAGCHCADCRRVAAEARRRQRRAAGAVPRRSRGDWVLRYRAGVG